MLGTECYDAPAVWVSVRGNEPSIKQEDIKLEDVKLEDVKLEDTEMNVGTIDLTSNFYEIERSREYDFSAPSSPESTGRSVPSVDSSPSNTPSSSPAHACNFDYEPLEAQLDGTCPSWELFNDGCLGSEDDAEALAARLEVASPARALHELELEDEPPAAEAEIEALCESVADFAERKGIDAPIARAAVAVLEGEVSGRAAIEGLMERPYRGR